MGDKDKKNNYLIYFLTLILIILCILVFIFLIRYFKIGNTTNILPRLTLDLYDDLDAFMQYDY